MNEYLQATQTIESTHPDIIAFTQQHLSDATTDIEKTINLYKAVRDEIRYDPYSIDFSIEGLRASDTLKKRRGWCVPKAILFAACCRSVNIPAKLGFADVRNHMSTARMRDAMKTDVFYWHGYTSIFLNEKWVKATPAFNKTLCEKINLAILEFDGENDSLSQEYDAAGNRYMEYLHDRGQYSDLPLNEMVVDMRKYYGADIEAALNGNNLDARNFETEIQTEIS